MCQQSEVENETSSLESPSGQNGDRFCPEGMTGAGTYSTDDIFVIENDFIVDVLHHKLIANVSRSSSIEIGMNSEIFGSHCFSECRSHSSIIFESNSLLTRIESFAFSFASLQSIVIPRNGQFVDSSAFIGMTLSSIAVESENDIFVIENDFLINVLHKKMIRNFSKSSEIEIGMNIEILRSSCFSFCRSHSSVTFESNSCLTRIESFAFSFSSLQSILIPSNVELLGSKCFQNVNHFHSSHLNQIHT
jgi:hypothetical protein